MRLVSCYIENFGTLHQEEISFSSGVTMLFRENGWGKSTLAAFLRVMFYGFENERSRDSYQNERKRYAPWQGGIYGGTVQFVHEGKEYTLTRRFGSKEKEDQYSLRDTATNLESKDFSSSLGMELFHLDSASFLRTMFFTQQDCQTFATDGIHAKLGNLVEHTHDMNSYEVADQRLVGMLNTMSPTRKTGELYKKREELAFLEMELKEKPELETQFLSLSKKKKEKEASYQRMKLQQRYGTLLEQYQMKKREKDQVERYFREGIPKEEEVKEQLEKCADWKATKKMLSYLLERQESEAKDVDREWDGQKTDCNEKKDRKNRLLSIVFLFLGGLCLFKNIFLGIVLIFLGAGALLWNRRKEESFQKREDAEGTSRIGDGKDTDFSSLYRKNMEKEQRQREEIEDYLKEHGFSQEEDYQKCLFHMLSHVQQYQKAKQELQILSEAIDQLEGDEEVSAIEDLILPEDCTLQDIADQMEMLGKELSQIERDRDTLIKRRERLEEKELFYQEEKALYEKKRQQYDLLQKTRAYLQEAKVSFTARYRNPIQKGFAKYLTMLTEEKEEDYLVDANLQVTKKASDMQRESRFFSAGYRDLMGICMRMALLDAMYPGEKPFLVLDDPFVNLDTEKTKKGLHMIEELAKEYQVIYFTCHEGRSI